jgi:anaerobic selenocysteine-containing dehydrogenase
MALQRLHAEASAQTDRESGENKWKEISWDQAMDEIADKLKALKEKYGPETLAVTEARIEATCTESGRVF